MKPDFTHASAAFKRLNPHLCRVGGLPAPQCQPDVARPLDRQPTPAPDRLAKVGRRPRVTLLVLRRRPLDDDNLIGGCKYLRDAIAASLNRDDAQIDWEYHQVLTRGKTGTLVKIENLISDL